MMNRVDCNLNSCMRHIGYHRLTDIGGENILLPAIKKKIIKINNNKE